MPNDNLGNVPTKRLVEELMKRKGVDEKEVAPYEPFSIADTGPCVVFVVKD